MFGIRRSLFLLEFCGRRPMAMQWHGIQCIDTVEHLLEYETVPFEADRRTELTRKNESKLVGVVEAYQWRASPCGTWYNSIWVPPRTQKFLRHASDSCRTERIKEKNTTASSVVGRKVFEVHCARRLCCTMDTTTEHQASIEELLYVVSEVCSANSICSRKPTKRNSR